MKLQRYFLNLGELQLFSMSLLLMLLAVTSVDAQDVSVQEISTDQAYYRTGSWYLSAGLGFSAGGGDDSRFQRILDDAMLPASILDFDDDRGGWAVGLGWQPWRYFAVEIEYLDLTDAEVRIGADNVNIAAAQRAVQGFVPLPSEGYSARFIGIMPLENQWRALVKVGHHQWQETGNRGDDESLYFALALDRYLTENVNVVFSLARYEIDGEAAPYANVGIGYYFDSKLEAEVSHNLTYDVAKLIRKPLTTKKGVVLCQTQCLLVNFASDSSLIVKIDKQYMSKIAHILQSNPKYKAVIQGHTDSSGSHSLNDTLSRARAEAVAILLKTEYGVDSKQIQMIGVGKTQPIASNETEFGKWQNRRVMINIETGS